MKKLYVIGALASLCLSTSVSAQNSATKTRANDNVSIMLPEHRSTANYNYYDADNERETVFVYTNDFSDETTFTLGTEGQGNWDLLSGATSADVDNYVGEMLSLTVDNGFVEFNGIQWLINTDDVMAQDATVTFTQEFDCSGLTEVWVSFTQLYRAFNVDETYIEISTNQGDDWESILINDQVIGNDPAIFGEFSKDITEFAAGEESVMLQFRWHSDYLENTPEAPQEDVNGFGSGYAWCIDDVMVTSPIESNLVIGNTYYNTYFETQALDSFADIDLLKGYEYHTQPYHSNFPFNFASIVTNEGVSDQTDVVLTVTFTDPDGNENGTPIVSDPITLASGESDTLWIYDFMPDAWVNPAAGLYGMDFTVSSSTPDELPLNNTGVSRFTRISGTDNVDAGSSWIQANNSNTRESGYTDNATQGMRYIFDEYSEDRVITHVEFALDDASQDGEIIFLNVRKGSVLEEEGPDNQMELYFSTNSGDPQAAEYITDASEFSTTSTPNWITKELPFPVLIEANTIYQAEVHMPDVGVPYCFVSGSSVRSNFIHTFYDYSEEPSGGPQGWWYYSSDNGNGYGTCIRLRTEIGNNVEDVTMENGMKLVQNFPNPFTTDTRFQYSIDETSQASIEVYDLNGKLVFQDDLGMVVGKSTNSYVMNRNGLAAGAYTYSIVTENERITRKMIIE